MRQAPPHAALQEPEGASASTSLPQHAASRGSATAAVIQAVYSCLRFHSINGSDLSKLCDIYNFGSFAAK